MSAAKRKIAFVHTSPAAVGPLMQFYSEAAPELEITNLLDDGILRLLAAKQQETAQRRFAEMIAVARQAYGAELAVLTCSAVPRPALLHLRDTAGLPVFKIDEPMARRAAQAGKRLGLIVTFPPTLETTRKMLDDAALEAGRSLEIVPEVLPEAYQALLSGDSEKHDAMLLAAVRRLEEQGVEAIVLAQVSMARILPKLDNRVAVPVLSSLHTSLDAVREILQEKR